MDYPQRITTVATEAVGDGLGVFDSERAQSFVLNSTSALVFQHCDGKTSPQQLTELLRREFNLPPTEADQVMRLALDELEEAGLLQTGVAHLPPPAAPMSRREALTAFSTAGVSVLLLPMVTAVAQAAGKSGGHNDDHHGDDHHHGGDDDDGHGHSGHTLIPLLECVDNNGDGTYTAHFGYLNQSGATINVAVGPKNMFVPGQLDFGQPTVFLPGEHLNVFSVVFPGTDDLKWLLKAAGDHRHQLVANAESEACAPSVTTTTEDPNA